MENWAKLSEEYKVYFIDSTFDESELNINIQQRRMIITPLFDSTKLTADIVADIGETCICHVNLDMLEIKHTQAFCYKDKKIVSGIDLRKIESVYFFDDFIEFCIKRFK